MNSDIFFTLTAVPVPLHIPPDCADCAEKSTVQLVSGSTCIAIVTKDGKFLFLVRYNE